jgi:hypothetical protein
MPADIMIMDARNDLRDLVMYIFGNRSLGSVIVLSFVPGTLDLLTLCHGSDNADMAECWKHPAII